MWKLSDYCLMISSISNARDQKNWVKNCKFSRKIGSHIWNVPNCQKVVVKTRTTTILKCQPAVLSRRMELFRFPTVAKNLRATAPLLSSFIFFRVRKGRAIDFFSQFFESVRRTQQPKGLLQDFQSFNAHQIWIRVLLQFSSTRPRQD